VSIDTVIGVVGLVAALLGGLAVYFVKLSEDLSARRAAEKALDLDIEPALAAAKQRVRHLWGAAEAQEISGHPEREIEALGQGAPEPPTQAVVDATWAKPIPPLKTWEEDRNRFEASLDAQVIQAVQRAALSIDSYNEAAADYNSTKANPPYIEARRALASIARAQTTGKETAQARRIIDRAPRALIGIAAFAAFVLGLLALVGVFSSAPAPTGTEVATALRAVLGAGELVECERDPNHYRCVAVDAACRTAAVTPTACNGTSGRKVVAYEAFVGQAAPVGRLAFPAAGARAQASNGVSCAASRTITAVSQGDLKELEDTPLAKLPKAVRLVKAIIACLSRKG
jgi:hypothetical protein